MSRELEMFSPEVQVMADSYQRRLGQISFVNAAYQIRDCLGFSPKSVLVIGVGAGLEPPILRSMGVDVTVFDIDPALNPDVLGSAHDLSCFATQQFDVIIVSHVLEHLPFGLFDQCLAEIARVGKAAVLYLPFACLVPELTLSVRPIFTQTVRLRLPLFWKTHKFDGEHYWEIGVKGYSLAKIRKHIMEPFDINREYHNWDWRYSYNFVLTSKPKKRTDRDLVIDDSPDMLSEK